MPLEAESLGIAVILLVGYGCGKLVQKFKLPMVVGYIIGGLLLSPSILNVISTELNQSLQVLETLGLGIVALFIGSELEFNKLKKLSRSILGIALIELTGTFVIVFAGMYYLVGLSLEVSMLLGAMAMATAPAATMAVIREYKAKGRLTSTLLGVVAVDDALCIIFFGIVSAIVGGILTGNGFTASNIVEPFIEISGSFVLGILSGLFIIILFKYTKNRHAKVLLLISLALLNSGIASTFHLSSLLTNMITGLTFANLYSRPQEIAYLEDVETPIYVAFFVLAGTGLHLDVLLSNWVFAIGYMIFRTIGKLGGSYVGAKISGADDVVQKYLGFAMFSKAGVSIGLLVMVQDQFPDIAVMITAIELAAITIFEIFGPLGAKFALISSGETEV
ncbi:cation:proton antiporter [Natranaerobius trueperi]|uniref:Cation/H+ exchanger transmembrane domain-containing protein n=1 Tax=Natranaerobius trueperi TaxID=759412 RepID=A0A226C3H9_9FIRM|nr:cation:proton antiporter [Natranaerobius trueperi]OWZ85029.1 hypothetical protein CDO51_01135 [Natranaerobius trueperi]